MVVSHGVEVHRRISVGGQGPRRTDGYAADVGRVEQNLWTVICVDRRTGVERSVGMSGVWRGDDDPRLLTGDGHPWRADVKPQPSGGIHVRRGG